MANVWQTSPRLHQHPRGYTPKGKAPVIARFLVTHRQALAWENLALMSKFVQLEITVETIVSRTLPN
nr:hypothetical protein [Candidatus Sigynarchaeota archaeon]